jgi:hypothetical protein
MQVLLESIDYDKFFWNICGDLKMVALVLEMQVGYTKYCRFLYERGC